MFQLEAQLNFMKKETNDYTYALAVDAKKMVEDFEMEAHNLDIVEREADDILKVWFVSSLSFIF